MKIIIDSKYKSIRNKLNKQITDKELHTFWKNTCHGRLVSFKEFKENYFRK